MSIEFAQDAGGGAAPPAPALAPLPAVAVAPAEFAPAALDPAALDPAALDPAVLDPLIPVPVVAGPLPLVPVLLVPALPARPAPAMPPLALLRPVVPEDPLWPATTPAPADGGAPLTPALEVADGRPFSSPAQASKNSDPITQLAPCVVFLTHATSMFELYP